MSVYVVKLGSDNRDAYLGHEGGAVRREYARRFSSQHEARFAMNNWRGLPDWKVVKLVPRRFVAT